MKKRYAYLAAALVMGASPAAAQNVSVSMTVPVVLTLGVSGSVTLANADDAAFTAGYQQSSTDLTVTHKGNVRHRVQIAGPSGLTNLGFAALAGRTEADPGKPLSDVRLSRDNFTTTVNLGTSAAPATLIEQASATSSGSSTVKTRMMLGNYATIPGTYSTTVTFTIVEY